MAKPRFFLSSTFYDLKHIRVDINNYLSSIGYEVITNENGYIPYGKDSKLENYCYAEINKTDFLICIIGGRFGSQSIHSEESITQTELKVAQSLDKQVYIFIDKNVRTEYYTYLENKGNEDIKYAFVDDIKIFKFIDQMMNLEKNNQIHEFSSSNDIIHYLKNQLASYFSMLIYDSNNKDDINNNTTSEGFENKNVIFDSVDQYQNPLFNDLKTKLKIPYNFYFQNKYELIKLLKARKYVCIDEDSLDFHKETENKKYKLSVDNSLFNKDNTLILLKNKEYNTTKRVTQQITKK